MTTDKVVKLQVQEILSYTVQGAEHMAAFKSKTWDGRSSFFNYSVGSFPRGFVALVQSRLNKIGHKVQIVKNPLPAPLGVAMPIVDDFGDDPRYDYQYEVLRKLEAYGQIIAQVATGGGKSRVAKLATARINRRTLFLTTRGVLMYQMYDSFKKLNPNTSVLGDGNLEVSDITCGMVQTIASHIEETTLQGEKERLADLMMAKEERQVEKLTEELKKTMKKPLVDSRIEKLRAQQAKERPSNKEFNSQALQSYNTKEKRRQVMLNTLKSFEFIILEEAHESSGNSYYDILRNCPNAHYRLSLTATPFMKDSEEANMRLMACSGHVSVTVSEELLIQRGILANPYFKYCPLPAKPENLYKSSSWARAYELGIVENTYRNKLIVAECIRAKSYGLTGLVLVQHKAHGVALKKLLASFGLRVEYIAGENDQIERKRALAQLKEEEIDVLIGSTILDVGVDVPSIGFIVLAGGGKAEVALRQRVGRGLRAKKKGPNITFVIDFADDFNTHLKEHYLTRRDIIESTRGFGNNILKDFDYQKLGFKKVA